MGNPCHAVAERRRFLGIGSCPAPECCRVPVRWLVGLGSAEWYVVGECRCGATWVLYQSHPYWVLQSVS